MMPIIISTKAIPTPDAEPGCSPIGAFAVESTSVYVLLW